jgi:hypothetical protein
MTWITLLISFNLSRRQLARVPTLVHIFLFLAFLSLSLLLVGGSHLL